MTEAQAKAQAADERRQAGIQVEDSVRSTCEGRSDLWYAIMYRYLHAQGWTLEKAKEEKRKAGLYD